MTVVTGSIAATATPATDMWAVLETALGANANWTQSGITNPTLSAADAGTTADCEIWKCTGGIADFYICVEIDDANGRIRLRAAENYEDGGAAVKKIRRPAGVGGTAATTSDTTAVTPTAQDTVSESDLSWGSTNPYVNYWAIGMAPAGFNYVFEVRDNLIVFATRSGAVNYYGLAGEFTPISTVYSDTHPLMVAGDAFNGNTATLGTSGSKAAGFSRCPAAGGASTQGAFCGGIMPLHYPIAAASPSSNASGALGEIGATGHKFIPNGVFVSPAIVHHTAGGLISPTRSFRGYLPDMVCTLTTSSTPPTVGDTLTIDGVTYYFLGASYSAGATFSNNTDPVLYIKG